MAPGANPRPYRGFLIPSLHRRFINASFYSAVVCYIISVWMGQWNHFIWSWFPVGIVGLRAFALFLPALSVLIPRVAQFHFGNRNTTLPFETAWKYTLRKSTFVTLASYSLSGWLFCEIYIASRPASKRLATTDPGKPYERIKLNERPQYLRFLFITLAVIQGFIHLWRDYDRVQAVPVMPKRSSRDNTSVSNPSSGSAVRQLFSFQKIETFAKNAASTASVAFVVGNIVYFAGLRYPLWGWYATIARTHATFGKSTRPSGLPPFYELVLMFFAEGPILAMLWAFMNESFDFFIAQEPLKEGKPITNDSKDPNGSLLNGLKSKKQQVRNIAFWELAMITDRFDDRRKTIFGELDRKKAPTYQQVTELCLAEVSEIVRRINVVDPAYRPEDEKGKPKPPLPIDFAPRISQPLKDGQVIAPNPVPSSKLKLIEDTTARIARTHSSPQNAQNAAARELIKATQGKFSEGAKQAESQWQIYKHKFASSPLGWPWRQSLHRTANTVVNGAPYSRQFLICNAVTALTNLAVASLKEDEFGQFQKQVPEIVRAFTVAIKKIEAYIQGLVVHWTDIDTLALPEADRKRVPEVELVVDCLKVGLERVLGAFNEYLSAMEMSKTEIQEAKKYAARPPAPASS
ncbi:nuclear envelope protein-like protein [Lojkania enalia]|uniref:Nuclear envelope protein-like protein n=1 Tax=Lojkania enalia TaxID=147567 RepID=A0A9P4K6Q2_9PLEO|nr:nuclear envelope protein-like protein [Didymosphaeria enalia]